MSKDMMPGSSSISRHRGGRRGAAVGASATTGWLLAGGNDSFDWFKDRVKRPRYVVDSAPSSRCGDPRDATGASRSAR
jgi:hypothetical protein